MIEGLLEDFFVFPEYWWVLLVAVPVLALVFSIFMKSYQAMRIWFGPEDYSLFFPEVKLFLRGGAVLFLGLAILSPYWGRTEKVVAKKGREIMILLDVSASMNTEDIQPSRLLKVKSELKEMAAQMKGDKFGLITFTSQAQLQAPLTQDFNHVMRMLNLVGTNNFSNKGTNFRDALSLAYNRFAEDESSGKNVGKAIILISDGENFGDPYTSVADRLEEENVKVFTVGVGTAAGGQVPDIDSRTGQKRYKRDPKTGGPAISTLKEDDLQKLAERFGTEYHRIDEPTDDLVPIMSQIMTMTSAVMSRDAQLASVNRFQLFLLLSVLMLGASMVIMPIGKTERSRPQGRQ